MVARKAVLVRVASSRARSPSKRDVVVIALADLGANAAVVDTEDVAVCAFGLAPRAFAWRKYPDQIDLDSVRVSLTDACKEKYGALAAGSVKEGWHLTPAGVAWVAQHGTRVRERLARSSPATRPEVRLETLHTASEAARVRSSKAFRSWMAGLDVDARTAAAAFRVDSYTSKRDTNLKLNRLAKIAVELNDTELADFVEQMTSLVLRMASKITPPSDRSKG